MCSYYAVLWRRCDESPDLSLLGTTAKDTQIQCIKRSDASLLERGIPASAVHFSVMGSNSYSLHPINYFSKKMTIDHHDVDPLCSFLPGTP